jgi:hypothetical protein
MRNNIIFGLLLAGFLWVVTAEAVQTKLIVRAQSKDAKFIGTSMGGALVTIIDSKTGEIITQGLTAGTTGNTKKIMIDPLQRGARLTDDSTAQFETTIDMDEPKLVTIEVQAPYVRKEFMIKSSTQVWLIPGKDIVGDGVVIEIPGFSVQVLLPQKGEKIQVINKTTTISVQAHIVMI